MQRIGTTVEVVVDRLCSKVRPFDVRVSWCKTRDPHGRAWVQDSVSEQLEMAPLSEMWSMEVGDRRRYRVRLELSGAIDTFGEYDEELNVLRCKRVTKRRGRGRPSRGR